MKKGDLLSKVAQRAKLKNGVANRVIKSLVRTIADSVSRGEKVTLSGLGTFRVKTRKAKPARNLQTGETVYLPEGKKISFKPSLSFKRLLKQVQAESALAVEAPPQPEQPQPPEQPEPQEGQMS